MNCLAIRRLIQWHTLLTLAALLSSLPVQAANSIVAGEFTGREPSGYFAGIRTCGIDPGRARYSVVQDLTVDVTGSFFAAKPNYAAGLSPSVLIYEAPFSDGVRVPFDEGYALEQGRQYDLVIAVGCPLFFGPRGFWTVVFTGPGTVTAPSHQGTFDDFMQGQFASTDPVLENFDCGEGASHYQTSGEVRAHQTADYFFGTTNLTGQLPICVLVYAHYFEPESPQLNLVATFRHSGPGAVRLEKDTNYVFVAVAGGDLAQFDGDYFYLLTEQAPFRINPALNGGWFNPETPGQGFFIEVLDRRNEMFVGWFTFEVPGVPTTTSANFGGSEQRWLTAFGAINANRTGTEELIIERTQGGVFDDGQPAVEQTADGRLKVSFENCDAGKVEYSIERLDLEGEIPIQRISDARSGQCRDNYRGPGIPGGVNPACIGCWDK